MKVFFILLSALLAILYPLLIHLGITHISPRTLAFIVMAFVGVRVAILAFRKQFDLKPYLPFMAVGLGSAALVFVCDNAKLLLHIPTLVNVSLCIIFLRSYVRPPTTIETFARADFPVMPANAVHYCRRVTLVWSASFLLCAAVCFYLAQFGPRSFWIAWSSVGLYVYHGAVFGIEYLYRRTKKVPQFEQALKEMGLAAQA